MCGFFKAIDLIHFKLTDHKKVRHIMSKNKKNSDKNKDKEELDYNGKD